MQPKLHKKKNFLNFQLYNQACIREKMKKNEHKYSSAIYEQTLGE